jgi:hypothetical protein
LSFNASIFSIHASPLQIWLEDYFHGELNLARGGGCPGELTYTLRQRPSSIEDVSVGRGRWRGKIRMVENIEYFRAELHIEVLGNSLDVIILEY